MITVRTIIFAKAPIAGFAKTRLIPALGLKGAADIAQRLLCHTVQQAVAANTGPVELCATPGRDFHSVWPQLNIPASVCWSRQAEGDLGQRLLAAAHPAVANDEAVLLIGTDCPALNSTVLIQAAEAMQHADACIVPARDGGFVLLGLRHHDPKLLQDLPWSTDQIAHLLIQRLQNRGWRWWHFPALQDVDSPEDLGCLPEDWLRTVPVVASSEKI